MFPASIKLPCCKCKPQTNLEVSYGLAPVYETLLTCNMCYVKFNIHKWIIHAGKIVLLIQNAVIYVSSLTVFSCAR